MIVKTSTTHLQQGMHQSHWNSSIYLVHMKTTYSQTFKEYSYKIYDTKMKVWSLNELQVLSKCYKIHWYNEHHYLQ